MKTIKLYLLRHGLTQANIDGIYLGHTDISLCKKGKEAINDFLKNYSYPDVSCIFSSPLKRAVETSSIIYPDKNPIIINDLIEYNFGEFEGRGAKELFEKAPLFERWLKGETGVRPPFGESNEEFASRVCSCFVKIVDGLIKENADDAMIITHGGVIATILSNCALPEAQVHEWQCEPAMGYTLRIHPQLWSSARKAEVIDKIPVSVNKNRYFYDGWDYYPDDDDYDISRDVYEDYDPFKEGKI